MQTLTTTTFVIQALRREIQKKYPEMSFVYSESLDYSFVETEDRADSSENISRKSSLPLLAFNRSPLRPSELGSRGNRFSAFAPIPNTVSDVIKYRTAHCEVDFNFCLIDKDLAIIESFEIDYMSKEGLGRITEIEVDFSSANLGFLKYYVVWNPILGNLQLNNQENSYVSISGTATVKGFFVSLFGQAPVITSINLSLKDQFKEIEKLTIR